MFRLASALFAILATIGIGAPGQAEKLSDHLSWQPGAVNGVLVEQAGQRLAVYGWPRNEEKQIERVLLTHSRRDVVWLAQPLIAAGAKATAPARELFYLEKPHEFWDAFTKTRFHDYAQQTTKILPSPLAIESWVKDGELIEWHGLKFRVIDTSAFTRGSASYIVEIDGKKVAFTGDLIYGDGKILDLYSFQDAIKEANVGGYHGYGGRLADLVGALRKIAAEKPDLILPARGQVIRNPQQAIEKLIARVQALYKNYLSTNALHWYFKKDRMTICGRRVLGADADVQLMPYSRHEKTPNWVFENGTSRLLISESGSGFLLDCGSPRILDAIKEVVAKGIVKQVDGIFVTHFHDDHTNAVQAAAEHFNCPVYATTEYADVLERPGAYHLPAMTENAIKNVKAMKNGQTMKWREFDFTFHFYPGQTYYHGGLYVRKQDEKPIFFIGDSFAPSGFDDYCVLNRNLLHEDSGYLLCLNKLRAINEEFWLVNEHIRHVFSFSKEEMDFLENSYRERIKIQRELYPWDDPNYGIDEQWVVFYPHGSTIAAGKSAKLEVRITNHSPIKRTFVIKPHAHGGLKLRLSEAKITLESRQSGSLAVPVTAESQPGNYLITADIQSKGMDFREWIEALVTIED
jgi:glyoxylase-like metal-dependent hydrolase (beta-lactamase superfamily II)